MKWFSKRIYLSFLTLQVKLKQSTEPFHIRQTAINSQLPNHDHSVFNLTVLDDLKFVGDCPRDLGRQLQGEKREIGKE